MKLIKYRFMYYNNIFDIKEKKYRQFGTYGELLNQKYMFILKNYFLDKI